MASKNRRHRVLRIALWVIGGGLTILGLLVIWFLWWGPVAISDRAMLWRMIRGTPVDPPSAEVVASQLTVPPGYRIAIWARDLPSVRLLRPLPDGSLIASQPRGGRVVLLRADRNGDGLSDSTQVLLEGLDGPNGVDVGGGFLYVAERAAVGRVPFDEAGGRVIGAYSHIVSGLTGDGAHWRKALRLGPDGGLFVGLGSTCNVCVEKDPRRAAIMRFEVDGSGGRVFATGLRNPYGFDWAPWDGAMYATENGRDLLGDDLPPDELNRIEDGGFYGWPWRHGADLADPDMDPGPAALLAASRSPAHGFRAHNAPLGIRFLRHPVHGPDYARAALVALHGSWNRSTPDGYAVVSLHWSPDGRIDERTFIGGFRGPSGLIGRPVDVAEAADGSIFVSDDYAGVIYRVTREAP